MLWLYLDFYALQLDALHLSPPEQKQELTPAQEVVILVDGKKNRVVQVSFGAKQQGIKVGMGMAMAVSLHHDVQVLEYQPEHEGKLLTQIAQHLYQYSADIALLPPQGIALRIDTMLRLYQGLEGYWQTLTQQLQCFVYRYSYATGATPLMAQLLAQAKLNVLSDDHPLLKQHLGQLPIAAMALDTKTQDALSRVGIKHIRQLLTTPMKELAKRFDIHLLNYLGKLFGDFKHGLSLYQPPEYFCRDMQLMYEIENTQVLQHPLKRLLAQLEQFLQSRNLVTQQLDIDLIYRYQQEQGVSIHRASGEYRMAKWAALIQLRLESVKLSEPVVALRLSARRLRPMITTSESLFSGKTPSINEDELIALLQAKVGDQRVKTLQLNQQHHPQLVSQLHSPSFLEKNSNATKTSELPLKLRPSLLLAAPKRLYEEVDILQGPERIETSWWHQHNMLRDYYIGRTHSGRLCWLFRTPQQQWYVQGYFA